MTESKKGAGDFGRRRRRQGGSSCYKLAFTAPRIWSTTMLWLCRGAAGPSKDRVGAEAQSK